MAYSFTIPLGVDTILQSEAREFIDQLVGRRASHQSFRVGESFREYFLDLESVQQKRSILNSAKDTGNLVHVIYSESGAEFCAVSGPDRNGKHEVKALFKENMAERLNRAVEWMDKNWSEELEVVILDVPALYLSICWLKDRKNSRFYLVSSKQVEDQPTGELNETKLLDFMTKLCKDRGL